MKFLRVLLLTALLSVGCVTPLQAQTYVVQPVVVTTTVCDFSLMWRYEGRYTMEYGPLTLYPGVIEYNHGWGFRNDFCYQVYMSRLNWRRYHRDMFYRYGYNWYAWAPWYSYTWQPRYPKRVVIAKQLPPRRVRPVNAASRSRRVAPTRSLSDLRRVARRAQSGVRPVQERQATRSAPARIRTSTGYRSPTRQRAVRPTVQKPSSRRRITVRRRKP